MRGFQFKMVIYRLLNSSPPETLTYITYGIISSEKNPDTSWVTQMTKNPHQKGLGHTLNYQEPLRKESGLDNHKDLRTNQELGMGWMLRVLLCKTTPSGLREWLFYILLRNQHKGKWRNSRICSKQKNKIKFKRILMKCIQALPGLGFFGPYSTMPSLCWDSVSSFPLPTSSFPIFSSEPVFSFIRSPRALFNIYQENSI